MKNNDVRQLVYPEPPENLKTLNIKNIFKYFGPGIIIASVTIGSGELVWASRSGAIFGYSMMWCFLYAGIFKAIQIYSAARHFTITGQHPMENWKNLPGPRNWFPLLIFIPFIFIIPIGFSGIPEILATYIHRLLGFAENGAAVGIWGHHEFWMNGWATLVILGSLALALISSYGRVEKISALILGIMLFCLVITVFVNMPDIVKIIQGLAIPMVKPYESWIIQGNEFQEIASRSPWLELSLYLTAVGGGTQDYVGYVGFLREKGWGLIGKKVISKNEMAALQDNKEEVMRAKIWSRAPLLDIGLSFGLVILVTLLFTVLGASILHPNHVIPDGGQFLSAQESYLTILHPQLVWLYRICVFLAFTGTLYGAFAVYKQTFYESVIVIVKRKLPKAESSLWKYIVYTYCVVSGLVFIWLPESIAGTIVDRMIFGSLITGAASCGLWCFIMLWVDYRDVAPAFRMSKMLQVMLVLAGIVMTGLGIKAIITYLS